MEGLGSKTPVSKPVCPSSSPNPEVSNSWQGYFYLGQRQKAATDEGSIT